MGSLSESTVLLFFFTAPFSVAVLSEQEGLICVHYIHVTPSSRICGVEKI